MLSLRGLSFFLLTIGCTFNNGRIPTLSKLCQDVIEKNNIKKKDLCALEQPGNVQNTKKKENSGK